jgi:DNA-directed RNA polymerase specialized sigma24 family protein
MSPEDEDVVTSRSPNEALKAIQSLTASEKAALLKIAKAYARSRKTKYDHEDLLQEAIVRVLEGRRKWPTGVPFMAFMCGAMRGIAWDWRSEVHDGDPDETARPEESSAIARIDAQKLVALFADDPLAQELVVGMMEGARGEELWESSGLTKTEYESKRRKIRRRIERQWLEQDAEKSHDDAIHQA